LSCKWFGCGVPSAAKRRYPLHHQFEYTPDASQALVSSTETGFGTTIALIAIFHHNNMECQMKIFSCLLFSLSVFAANIANATPTDYSFTGNLANDDQVQFFNFSVAAPSTVTLRTWSYAGGTNANGQAIAAGGFDPILALFDDTGLRINQNDDGGFLVAADPVTGMHYDTYLSSVLGTGNYTVSVSQFSNFAGATLSSPFPGSGTSGFVDVTGATRTSAWAFDILGVEAATQTAVPEPSVLALLGLGLFGVAAARRRKS
jgi:hypothetical protein